MRRLALALLVLSATVSVARAQAPVRVVLATPDPALAVALEAALAPWQVELRVLDDPTLGATMPSAADRGAALARAHDATAVAWISSDENGAHALWIYDGGSGRVVARPLPIGPPFDEPTADSVALAIKTMLRHSAAAPPSERVIDPLPASALRLEIAGGVRALATSPADVEPRAALALAFWPRELGGVLGAALTVRGGTGIVVDHAPLAGRYGALDLHLGLRLRGVPTPLLDLEGGIDLGATLSWLEATITDDGRHTMPFSADATGLAWVGLGVRPLGALRIGLRIGVLVSPRTRDYLVRGSLLLATQLTAPYADLVIELPLDGGRVDSP